METEEQIKETPQVNLLEKINKALEDLGSTTRWKLTPEFIEGCEVLKDKVIVMVDDVKIVLESFAPDLMVATDGKANFVEYKGQKLNELLDQILQYNPNIILLDYHLSDQLKGSEVLKALRESGFSGDAIGFSSDSHVISQFKTAGAKACIDKDAGQPEISVKELAEVITKT